MTALPRGASFCKRERTQVARCEKYVMECSFFPAKRVFDIWYLKIFDSAFCLEIDDNWEYLSLKNFKKMKLFFKTKKEKLLGEFVEKLMFCIFKINLLNIS